MSSQHPCRAAPHAVPPGLTFARGFTLTEMAVVLLIVAILIAGLVIPLSTQQEVKARQDTEKTLSDIREALLGFAAANGRLPCPATAASNGLEAPVTGGVCTLSDPADAVPAGFVPGVTLGLAPLDATGRVLDAWGNPVRYAVTNSNSSAFTTFDGVRNIGMANIALPLLHVCSSGNGMQNAGTASAACPAGGDLTTSAVAVLHAVGKNAGSGGTGTDERHNPNPNMPSATLPADRAFVSHQPAPADAPQGEFDDIVAWLPTSVLYNRMVAAGRLP